MRGLYSKIKGQGDESEKFAFTGFWEGEDGIPAGFAACFIYIHIHTLISHINKLYMMNYKRETEANSCQELFRIVFHFFKKAPKCTIVKSQGPPQGPNVQRNDDTGAAKGNVQAGHRLTSRLASQTLGTGGSLRGSKNGCFRASANVSLLAGSYSSMPSMRSKSWWCSSVSDARYLCGDKKGQMSRDPGLRFPLGH